MSKSKDWKDPKDYLIEAYTNKLINDYKQTEEKEQERQRQRALSSPSTSNTTNSPTSSQNSSYSSQAVSQSTPAERDLFKITGRRHTVTDRRRGIDKNEKTQRTANISGQNRGLSRDDNDRFTNTVKGAGKQWLGGQLSGIGTTAQADIVNINSIRGAKAERENDYRLTSREEAEKREAESVNKSRTKDGVNLRDMERRYSLDPVGNVSDNYRKIVKGTQNIINKGDSLIESGTQDIEKAKEGANDFEKFLIDNGAQFTQWAGDASLRMIPIVGQALSMGGFFNRAGGMSAYQGRQEGMNPDQQFKYYAGSGLMEVLSELTFQSVGALRATYGKGMFSIADKLTTKASTSGIVNRLLNNTELGKSLFINMARLGGNAVEEGLEEVETDLVDPLLKYFIKKSEDPRAEFEGWDFPQMGYDFLMGATMGGVLGVAEVPNRVKYELNIANSDAFNDGMTTSLIKQASVQGRQSDGGRLIPTNAEILAQQLQQQMDNNIPVQPAQIRMLQEAIGQSISENQKQLTRKMTQEYDKAQKSGDLVQMEGTRLESQGIDNASVKLVDEAVEKARQVIGENATQEDAEAVAGVTTGVASTNEIDTVLAKPELKKAVETIVNEGADAESAVSIPVNNAEARDVLENLTAVKRIANRNTILKDVQAKNAEIIKSSVDNMSEGGKNLFASRAEFAQDTIGGNRDRNLEIYRDRFSRLYTDGNTKGADFETSYKRIIGSLDSEALKSVFTEDFARQIFDEGRNAIVTDTAKETAKSRAEEYANRKGGLTFENNNENLISARERDELQKFAERVGVEINVVKSLSKDASGKALMSRTGKKLVVNGKYQDGVITIASDAQNKLITVAKHELTHHLKETSPEMYQKLEDFVFERWYHGNAEEMEDEIARYTKLYSGQGLDRAGIREEIIADASEAFFTDEGAIQDAISFSEKLGRAIHDGIKTMLDAFLGLQDADSRRMRGYGGFLKDLGILQEAERMWLEALEDTQQRKRNARGNATAEATSETEGKLSVTPEEDQAYMDAVNRGDMETAQRMVDEQAKRNGYDIKAYHGTPNEKFTVFNADITGWNGKMFGRGNYFSSERDVAKTYSGRSTYRDEDGNIKTREGNIYDTYLNLGNSFTVDLDEELAKGRKGIRKYSELRNKIYAETKLSGVEYDSVTIKNIKDGSNTKSDVYIVADPNRIKSADPVTYDDDGNVIPLSERFNEGNEDIRWSVSEDSDGNKLSEGQREYFKDSKAVDENGNLLVLYHSSPEQFTAFNPKKLGRNTHYDNTAYGHFVTDYQPFSSRFGENQMKLYANIKKLAIDPWKASIKYSGDELERITREWLEVTDPEQLQVYEEYKEDDPDLTLNEFYEDLWSMEDDPNEYARYNKRALKKAGYDAVEVFEGYQDELSPDGSGEHIPVTTYAVFNSNQLKSVDNLNPTRDKDIRYSLSSSFEAVGCDIRKENGLIKAYDGDGNEVKSFKPSDIRRSPLGRLLQLAVGRRILSDKDVTQQVDFLSRLYNMILNTQDPDLIWAVSGTIGYDPKHGIGKNTDWLKEAKSKFASITGNADPQYKTTIDFTTICVKTQAIIDAMSKVMIDLGRGLTEHEIIDIVYKETAMAGEQVPCPVCYVFSRWVGLGNLFGKIKEFQQDYPEDMDMTEVRKEYDRIKKEVDALVKEQTGKKSSGKAREQLYKETIERKDLLDLKKQMPDKKLTEAEKKELEDLNRRLDILDHWSWLEKTRLADDYKAVPDDVLFDLNAGRTFATDYPATWRFRTTRGPSLGKAVAPYSPSRLGDTIRGIASPSTLAKLGNSKRVFLNPNSLTSTARKAYDKAIANAKRQNRMNGQRLQSTSDFRFEYGLDYLLSFIELEAIGAKAQMYTKVPEAVKFLASTGTEVNCSIMAKGSGLDEKGNLIFSDITGMAWEDALMLSQMYDNVQPILVAIGREHLIKAMAHKAITMIIPYHASGSSESRYRSMMEAVGEAVEDRTDFAEYENEHDRDDATPEQKLCRKLRMDILTGKYANKELDTKERTALKNNDILRQLYIRIYGKDINGNPAKPNRKYVENYDKDGNDADCYGVYLTKEQAGVMMPYEYWDKHSTIKDADKQGEAYIKYCESLGITPVFSGWDSKGKYDADMDFSSYTGYWKTLIDRCMYNNDGTYHKQQAVNVRNVDLDMLDSDEMKKGIFKPMQSQNAENTEVIAERAKKRIAEEDTSKLSVSDDEVLDRYIVDRQKRIDDGEQMSFFGSLNETLPSKPKEKTRSEKFYDNVLKTIANIKKKGSWSGFEVKGLFLQYPEFNFIERLNNKADETAVSDFNAFLSSFDKIDDLRSYNWFFSAYENSSQWKKANRSGKMKFNKLIENRIEEIMAGKAHGRNVGIEKRDYTPTEMRKLFNELNTDKELEELGKKVFDCIDKNFDVKFQGVANIEGFKHGQGGTLGQAGGRTVHLNMKYLNSEGYTDQQKASTILHESIHTVTVYALRNRNNYTMPKNIQDACDVIEDVFWQIKNDPLFKGEYGVSKGAEEMVAELANPIFREKLKRKNVFARVIEAIRNILGIEVEVGDRPNAFKEVNKALETLMSNADVVSFERYANKVSRDYNGKFSVSEEDENASTPKEYQSTIAKLEEKVADLKSEFKRTDLKTADPKQTRIQAGRLLKRHDSNLTLQNDVVKAFNDIFKLYKKDGTKAFDEAYEIAQRTAVEVVNGIQVIHDEGADEYQAIKDYFKNLKNGIRITDEMKRNITDYGDFYRRYGRKLNLRNGDTGNIDSVYMELAELFPMQFTEDYVNPADQLLHMADVLDSYAPYYETLDGASEEMQDYVVEIASDIMETAYGLQTKKTFADKKYLEKQKTVQEAYRKAREEALASRERALTKQAERYETKIAYLKQRNKDSKEETRERAEKKRRITQIAGIHKRLLEKLDNPKDTKHLPDGYAPIVSNVLSMFDFTTKGMEKWAERYGEPSKRYRYLDELRKRLADMSKEDSPIAESGFEIDPDIIEIIEELKADVADTDRLSDLDSATLEDIYTLFKAFEHQLNTFNKAFDENNRQTVIENRDNFISETRDKKTRKDKQGTIGWLQRQLETNNTTPEDFFHLIGGTPEKLYKSIRKGFDKHILNVKSAMDFIKATTEGKDVKKWSENVREYTTSFNETIKLTDAQLMSIYCLSKREQAQQHMYSENGGSGIVVVPQKVGKGLKAETLDRSNVVVNSSDIQKWISQLSKEQIEVADRLQRYLSEDMSKLGNETSLKLYGYKKFTEKNYFPIQSSNDWLNSNFDFKGDSPVLKNTGMTKALNKHASNPIVIDDIFTVATKHISTMSLYNSLVPSLTDFQRFWNSKDKDHNTTVQKEFIRVYGEPAYKYVENFMGDLNGAYKRGFEVEGVDKLMSKYKQASIGLNLRVLFQQPTAVARAGAVMNPIYITKALGASTTTLKQNLKDMREHCPIALWKSWGFYNTDLARDMRSIMMDEKTFSDNFSKAYGIADDLTWSVIFKAVRYEVEAQNKNLEVGSDEYWEKVNERASEVFDRTQVVDSPFHRSQNMRAKDNLSKMVTAFMAEPTKTYNMLKTELTLAKREIQSGQKAQGVKRASRVVQVFVTNALLVSASSAVIDALRGVGGSGDDDKDKNWFERFLAHWWTNTKDNINPLGLLPVFKDVQSVVQGYDVTRMDMQAIGRMVKSLQYMGEYIKEPENSKYTFKNEAHYLLQQSAYLVGLPLANLERDTRGIAFSIAEAVGYDDLFFEEAKFKYQVNDKTKSMWADMYLDAKYKGNSELAKKIHDYIIDGGVTQDYIDGREMDYAKAHKTESQQQTFDDTMNTLKASPVWSKATDKRKSDMEALAEKLSVGIKDNDTENFNKVITEGSKYGLTREEYLLYKLAKSAVADGNANSNDEKREALQMLISLNLSEKEKEILIKH